VTEAQRDEHVEAIRKLDHNRVRDWFEIGWRLNEIRKPTMPAEERVSRGDFLSWFKRQKFHFSVRSAQRMMNAAEAFEGKYDTVSHLPIRLSAIHALSSHVVLEEVRDEAIQIAQSGRTVTKAVVKALIKIHYGDDKYRADPFGGLTDDHFARVTGSFGFFRDESDLRRPTDDLRRYRKELRAAKEYLRRAMEAAAEAACPPGDIVWQLEFFITGVTRVQVRERRRRDNEHVKYLGEKIRDPHFAGEARREVIELQIDKLYGGDVDRLREEIERVCELRRRRGDA
jgi:hypothetical protein